MKLTEQLPQIAKVSSPFPAMHYVIGGGWDVPTGGGHLVEGTMVKGVLAVFITEITGIEVILPSHDRDKEAPESWYKEIE